jgi:hypothetical protein
MTVTITYAGATTPILPFDVAQYETGRPAGTVTHQIAGRADPDATLAPAGLRTGTLWLVFATEADAADAETRHGLASAFTLTDDETPSVGMYYVVANGDITRRYEAQLDDGRSLWMIGVPFQEISP